MNVLMMMMRVIMMKLGLMGDYVMVIHEPFRGYFAVVTDNSHGDKSEIQNFQNKEKWWILIENDFDSCLANELKPVKGRIDERSHYFF